MTNDARRTRGDAWAWLVLSLFGPSPADGAAGETADDEGSRAGTDTDAR